MRTDFRNSVCNKAELSLLVNVAVHPICYQATRMLRDLVRGRLIQTAGAYHFTGLKFRSR